MTDTKDTPSSAAQTSPLPAWLQPDWDGPAVELRPADADASWPEGAHHRVRFDQETFQIAFYVEHDGNDFYYEYFGADGWPLFVPEKLKSNLDNRCREDLHRFPYLWRKRCWNERSLQKTFEDADAFREKHSALDLVRSVRRAVPATAHTS